MEFIRILDVNNEWTIVAKKIVIMVCKKKYEPFTRIYLTQDDFIAVKPTPTEIYNQLLQ